MRKLCARSTPNVQEITLHFHYSYINFFHYVKNNFCTILSIRKRKVIKKPKPYSNEIKKKFEKPLMLEGKNILSKIDAIQ